MFECVVHISSGEQFIVMASNTVEMVSLTDWTTRPARTPVPPKDMFRMSPLQTSDGKTFMVAGGAHLPADAIYE